jgi:hypothetical protein
MTIGKRIRAFLSGGAAGASTPDVTPAPTYAPERDGEPDPGEVVWDSQGRPSEVRLDRLIHLERGGVRREGAALDETIFTAVVEARRGLSG